MNQRPILITGANGMIGRALTSALGSRAIPLSHKDCDICAPGAAALQIDRHHPGAIFNCAAITNVDLCEQDPDLAKKVNYEAVIMMAELCKKHDCTLIHFSTDYVFDGTGDVPWIETQTCHPINHYGFSKAKSEEAIAQIQPDYMIARVQWIFGEGRHNFIQDTAKKLLQGGEVRAFDDQWGTPSFSHDVASMVVRLYEDRHRGIFHVINSGYASRLEVAQEIARQLKIQIPRVLPVKSQDIHLPARRPKNSRLAIDKIQKLGIYPPAWQDAIKRYLHTITPS